MHYPKDTLELMAKIVLDALGKSDFRAQWLFAELSARTGLSVGQCMDNVRKLAERKDV